MKELSLRPYNGRLFVTKTKADYHRAHKKLFKDGDVIGCSTEGRFGGGCGPDGQWTYLVYAEKPHTMAHELAHAVLEVFDRCGIDPRQAHGEPFCYMLSQLMLEAK